MLFSINRGKAFAWTIAPSQPRQAYLGRIMRSTRRPSRTSLMF
jgi:hypothetical protein